MGWLVLNGNVTLDRLMFDNPPPLFEFMVGFVRAKASIILHIFDDAIMYKVGKLDVF